MRLEAGELQGQVGLDGRVDVGGPVRVDVEAAIERLIRFLSIDGVSGEEAAIAGAVSDALKNAGVPASNIRFDTANKRIPMPTQTGNLFVSLPGTRPGPRLVFSTHLDDASQSTRVTQMKQVISWAGTYPEQRLIGGDFNCWGSYIDTMETAYYDSWLTAASKGVQVAYSGNTSGSTKSGRIDYIFESKNATRLTLTRMQIYDTRDSSGYMPSDHRPIMATFAVQ